MTNEMVAIFGLPGGMEWIILLILGLLLFGRRLPDVARSVGKSIVEFKRGLKDVSREIDDESKRHEKLPPASTSSSESIGRPGEGSREKSEDPSQHTV